MIDPSAFGWALEKSDLAPATRWLLSRIAAHTDATAESLAAATHMSVRSVRTHLKLAEDAGWVIVDRRSGLRSRFTLVIPDGAS